MTQRGDSFALPFTSPDVDAYGAVLVGLPFLGITFNDRLGWTHTVNTYDGADLYVLQREGNGYRFDGEIRPFETRAELLKIRRDGDLPREEWLTIQSSVHGPVIGVNDDEAVALKVAALDASQLPRQAWEMMTARTMGEFEEALALLQLPMFTTDYADRDGNILHVFNGRVPVRASGDFAYWQGLVPGGSSSTLWHETHPYEDLPRVANPESGWLQYANDPPWTTTFPAELDPTAFPDYVAPRTMALRPQRLARVLADDSEIGFDEMIDYKHSTRMELADRLIDELVPLARTRGSVMAFPAASTMSSTSAT